MITIVTGYGREARHSIHDDEAHKAYHLFLNPEERGVFSNGVALVGKHIMSVEPDYHGTMGWNRTHVLDSDDMNELNTSGVARRLKDVLAKAKEVARLAPYNPGVLSLPLGKVEVTSLSEYPVDKRLATS